MRFPPPIGSIHLRCVHMVKVLRHKIVTFSQEVIPEERYPSVAVPKPADEVDHEVVSVTQLDPLTSAVDNERASYQRTLNCVLQWNSLSVPVPQRETTFGVTW